MSDLISRQSALDICNNAIYLWEGQIGEGALIAVKDKIAELPSADVPDINVGDMVSRHMVSSWLKQYGQDVLHGKYKFSLMYIWKNLMDLPSVESEIIRCKDCKYWTHIKRTNRYWCKTDDGLFDLNPSPDDFCSRAERRTDG